MTFTMTVTERTVLRTTIFNIFSAQRYECHLQNNNIRIKIEADLKINDINIFLETIFCFNLSQVPSLIVS